MPGHDNGLDKGQQTKIQTVLTEEMMINLSQMGFIPPKGAVSYLGGSLESNTVNCGSEGLSDTECFLLLSGDCLLFKKLQQAQNSVVR